MPKKRRSRARNTIRSRRQGFFANLKRLSAFRRRYLPFLRTLEDIDIVSEIGYFQEQGLRVSLKLLFLEHTKSVATVQRRINQLRRLGVVVARESPPDRRTLRLELSPVVLALFRRYNRLIATLW